MAYASASFLRSSEQKSGGPGSPLPLLDPDSSLDFLFTPPSPPRHPPPLNISSSIRELNHHEIELDRVIGQGSFGTVVKARWREMNIAIKYFKQFQQPPLPRSLRGRHDADTGSREEEEDSDSSDVDEFSREVETMARVCNHMFIIQLIGIVRTPHLSVVTMFYQNGSLEDLLVLKTKNLSHHSSFDTSTLVRFALEAAIGIRHLHLEGIIHRDLAARNLLVDDNLHIRVSDFGFSRMKEAGTTRGYTQSSLGPIRWSAPEAMRRKKFSEASDVFSFGVALYEIFVQELPWKELETVDVVIAVCGGERMSLPAAARIPPAIANLMTECWSHNPETRPLLPAIISTLRELKEESIPPVSTTETSERSLSSPQPQETKAEVVNPPTSSWPLLPSFPPPAARSVHRDLSLEIVTEPFQQTWEEYEASEDLPPNNIQRESSVSVSLSDEDFLRLVEENRLHSWGHEAALRVMYLMLQKNHRSSETVDRIIERFRSIQKEGFHMTIVYFWIQVTRLCLPPSNSLSSLSLITSSCANNRSRLFSTSTTLRTAPYVTPLLNSCNNLSMKSFETSCSIRSIIVALPSAIMESTSSVFLICSLFPASSPPLTPPLPLSRNFSNLASRDSSLSLSLSTSVHISKVEREVGVQYS